jgi:hypothetical protein
VPGSGAHCSGGRCTLFDRRSPDVRAYYIHVAGYRSFTMHWAYTCPPSYAPTEIVIILDQLKGTRLRNREVFHDLYGSAMSPTSSARGTVHRPIKGADLLLLIPYPSGKVLSSHPITGCPWHIVLIGRRA